ncbi:hypothetical protein EMIHUDRAFT_254550 [Emiliania huxleyi CCMP1516]|uniref:U-box domain-containing protein n=2 Tax=Emiliania huxleyi TaxID=2903 RepID=A0A0D3JQW4_EMIH1|nr:hypothetical protein EMIHUDRAFT_254550 [Emiliania huxleyi CCMP1516]EOD25899.1 hypothetical protein EMIHUDRAFT_254550 [Emiliania huxleyi CCMP1516]|eukprot:XP_005778328.1 hypothetical protein EMIHUDRAFT_254550 [Emiliania huxleyi CCMP1516]
MPSKRKSGATDAESKRQRAATLADEAASEFLCPITLELPLDPVTAADGHIYERSAIERHMATQGAALRSPITNMPMSPTLLEATQVRNAIEKLAAHIDGDKAKRWRRRLEESEKLVHLRRLAETGDPEAMLSLHFHYYFLKHQPEEAFHYAKIAADLGNARGLQKAGFALCHGKGVCKNQANGVALLAAAAGAGHGYAAYELGLVVFIL